MFLTSLYEMPCGRVVLTLELLLGLLVVPQSSLTDEESLEGALSAGEASTSLILNGIRSSPHMFYARLMFPEKLSPWPEIRRPYCGVSIIDKFWVVTGLKCLFGADPIRHLFVEVGDFSDPFGPRKNYGIQDFHISKELPEQHHSRYESSLALLKLRNPIEGPTELFVIPLCHTSTGPGTPLGTCGMGQNNTDPLQLPVALRQTYLRESSKPASDRKELLMCRKELVCTVSDSLLGHSTLCGMDEGNPLYTFECNSRVPRCLYGVAAFHWRLVDGLVKGCRESFFTSIPFHYSWIVEILAVF